MFQDRCDEGAIFHPVAKMAKQLCIAIYGLLFFVKYFFKINSHIQGQLIFRKISNFKSHMD